MGRYRGQSSTAQQGQASTRRDAANRDRARRDAEARQRWAVGACERCGRSAVLGEPMATVRRYDRDVVLCPECLDPAPARSASIVAPDRHGRAPVRLVATPIVHPAASRIEPPDERAA